MISVLNTYIILWSYLMAYGILVPQPETEVKVQSPNHWTAREFPQNLHFLTILLYFSMTLHTSVELLI